MSAAPPVLNHGFVKQVLSGDTVVIRGVPKGGPPPEKTLSLSNVIAPKLARRPVTPASPETKDEPFAWEAREFLRKKLIGKEVSFIVDYKIPGANRDCGFIYVGKDQTGENVTESLVAEGLVEVRKGAQKISDEHKRLIELEELARTASKGKWSSNATEHVRNIKWTIENPRNFVDSLNKKPVKAVIENLRDGCTVRAFLLPDFYYVTVNMSGIRCPSFKINEDKTQTPEPFADEAKYFTESLLLQRDVEINFDTVSNANFFGTVMHPNGNIAELLLRKGFARCVDWTIGLVTGKEKLRAAEKAAKEERLRLWKDYTPPTSTIEVKDKEFTGKVAEVVNADALVLKLADDTLKKIFLSSIRPPRLAENEKSSEVTKDAKGKQFRPLYDIPYMYEAREYLRQKLIGKKVNVTVDYVQPASNSFPEKTCCTVTISGSNVAETLVAKGLATVIRYRQDDDQRSLHYDELLAAESKAIKSKKGMHSKELPIHRVAEISGDATKAKQFLPFLQRAGRSTAVVEYVASGSRLRLYVQRETCLITFLLAGISCPRAARTGPGGPAITGEPYGDEALNFTKSLCLQQEVEIEVESMDKAGNFIGWLWFDSKNLSVALVEEGLASVHFTAERSTHFRALQIAEDAAKAAKLKMWANYEEPKVEDLIKEEEVKERNVNYKSIIITEVHPDFHFHAQHIDQGPQLETLMEQMRQELESHPPLSGAFNPKKNDLCAAKFIDGLWYRAKVEKVQGPSAVTVKYIDYGNTEVTKTTELATLPGNFSGVPAFAHEYAVACVELPKDPEYQQDTLKAFKEDTADRTLLMNVEYRVGNLEFVSLQYSENKDDVIKLLIEDGLLIVEPRKEKRLQKLLNEYKNSQESAKKKRNNIWCYGDFLEDEAKEFGFKR